MDYTQQDNTPDIKSPLVKSMQDELQFVRDVSAGWPTINKYLCQFAAEADQDFAARQKRPNFTDFLSPVVDAVIGKMFRNEPELLPATGRMADLWENIDGRGTKGHVFLQNHVQDSLVAGQGFILVDYPQITGNPTRGQRIASNIRAYWCPIMLDQVTNIQFSYDQEQQHLDLTLFAFKEVVEEYDKFKVTQIDQWRVLNKSPDGSLSYEKWRRDPKTLKMYLYEPPQPIVGVTDIPLVSINLRSVGHFASRPVFLELAYQALDYYLTTSDMSHAMQNTSYPTLFLKGFPDKTADGKPMAIGPGAVLSTANPAADAKYICGDGKGFDSALLYRESVRSQMAVVGLSFLEKDTKMAQTAQTKVIDAEIDAAKIDIIRQVTEDAVNQALIYTAQFEDVPAPTISLILAEPAAVQEQINVNTNGQSVTPTGTPIATPAVSGSN